MLIDASLILDTNLTLTTSGSSTNYIDTIGAAGGQAQIAGVNTIQGGYDAYVSDWFEAVITAAMTAGGTSLDVQLWTSQVVSSIWTTGNGGSKPVQTGTVELLIDSGPVLAANLTAKAVLIKARIPVGCQRYISAYYNCVGIFSGGGTISAFIVPDVDINLT